MVLAAITAPPCFQCAFMALACCLRLPLTSLCFLLAPVYIPDLAAYQRLSKDLTSHTRQRWGLSCVVQHPGWDYVFWDLASATQLVEKVRLHACLCCLPSWHWQSRQKPAAGLLQHCAVPHEMLLR